MLCLNEAWKETDLTVQFEKPGQSPGKQEKRKNKQIAYQLKPHKAFTKQNYHRLVSQWLIGSKIIEQSTLHVEPQVCEPALALKKIITEAAGSKCIEMKTIKGISRDISLTPRSSLVMGLKQFAFSS